MATEAQVIEYLRKLSKHKTRPERWEDWNAYDGSGGNVDDAYQMGTEDGEISLAKTMINALDSGAELPDVPEPIEDEDEDEE
jgi:hypothetical protein